MRAPNAGPGGSPWQYHHRSVSGVLASRRRCSRRKDAACYARDDDPEFFPWLAVDAVQRTQQPPSSIDGAFPWPRTELKETGLQTFRAGPKKHSESVHVAVAADRAHYVGLIACVGSVFAAGEGPSSAGAVPGQEGPPVQGQGELNVRSCP